MNIATTFNFTAEDIEFLTEVADATEQGSFVFALPSRMAAFVAFGLVVGNLKLISPADGESIAYRVTDEGATYVENARAAQSTLAAEDEAPILWLNEAPETAWTTSAVGRGAVAAVDAEPPATSVQGELVATPSWAVPAVEAPAAIFGELPVLNTPTVTAVPATVGQGFPIGVVGTKRRSPSRSPIPFDTMRTGDYYFVPATPEFPNPARKHASVVSSRNKKYKHFIPTREFAVYNVQQGEVIGSIVAPSDGAYIVRIV